MAQLSVDLSVEPFRRAKLPIAPFTNRPRLARYLHTKWVIIVPPLLILERYEKVPGWIYPTEADLINKEDPRTSGVFFDPSTDIWQTKRPFDFSNVSLTFQTSL